MGKITASCDVSLRQWYLSGNDPMAFRQLVERGDHRMADGFLPTAYSEGCELHWIMGMVERMVYGDELHYAFDLDGEAVGCLNVTRVEGDGRRTGEVHLMLLPEVCGQGVGTRAIGLLTAEAGQRFERLVAHVGRGNTAAARALQKNGFREEGSRDGRTTYVLTTATPAKRLTDEQRERLAMIRELLEKDGKSKSQKVVKE